MYLNYQTLTHSRFHNLFINPPLDLISFLLENRKTYDPSSSDCILYININIYTAAHHVRISPMPNKTNWPSIYRGWVEQQQRINRML